jgi:four helix bundle protein
MDLVKRLYLLTQSFPSEERFGLVSQIRRAAVSVPSNIAEGQARGGKKEFTQFLYIAKGSLAELDTQIELAKEIGFINADDSKEIGQSIAELQRMLHSLIQKVKA